MSWARRCSWYGCSATRASSSGISSPARPSARSASRRSSTAARRSSFRRATSEETASSWRTSCERLPPPEGKRRRSSLARPGGLVLEQWPRGACEALEARCIELIEIDPKEVAGRTRLQHLPAASSAPRGSRIRRSFETWNQSFRRASGGFVGQSTSTIRSVDTTSFGCCKSSASSVRCVGEPIRRRDAVVDDLDRAEHPEFQRHAQDFTASSLRRDLRKAEQRPRKGRAEHATCRVGGRNRRARGGFA